MKLAPLKFNRRGYLFVAMPELMRVKYTILWTEGDKTFIWWRSLNLDNGNWIDGKEHQSPDYLAAVKAANDDFCKLLELHEIIEKELVNV